MISLEESYRHCRAVAKARAKNFYYSFILLDPDRKNAMCAVYAFMRYCDDLSDEPGATRAAMERWREALANAFAEQPDDNPAWPGFLDSVSRYGIPHEYFFDMIDGVASDLELREMITFNDLYAYCYRVASVVGLTTIHIFGFNSASALQLAEECGVAFQLTNILRDIREDAELGRCYMPTDELEAFGVTRDDLAQARRTAQFGQLMDFQLARARDYYKRSAPIIGLISPETRPSMRALIGIYRSLLDRIAECPWDVLQRRISLPASEKIAILIEALLQKSKSAS